jgi:hypothetical protein
VFRQSVESYRKIFSMEGGELKQESRINCANALCDWGEIVSEIPTNKGGGTGLAADLYAQADVSNLRPFLFIFIFLQNIR